MFIQTFPQWGLFSPNIAVYCGYIYSVHIILFQITLSLYCDREII